MKRGIIVGKFYPPHRGHKYLIDIARSQVDRLTVIVCNKKSQNIPGALRAKWLKEIHSDVEIMVIENNLPAKDSKIWAKSVIKWLGFKPDIAFTSENYGDQYVKYLKCEHVTVDMERKNVPISGTLIRKDPLAYLEFLEPCVQDYFIKNSNKTLTPSFKKGVSEAPLA